MKCCVGLCAYNSEQGLPAVLRNIDAFSKLFEEVVIIVGYDESSDNTKKILTSYKNNKMIILNVDNNFGRNMAMISMKQGGGEDPRTVRIAKARNIILKEIYREYHAWDFFVMMDTNNYSCTSEIDVSVLESSLTRDDWDALSFNRNPYYDIWGLSIEPYVYSCWHFASGIYAVRKAQDFIVKKLSSISSEELLSVDSAFGGFSIYRTKKFRECCYSGLFHDTLFTREQLKEHCRAVNSNFIMQIDDCEHRWFHKMAIAKNNAKIRISPKLLFPHAVS